MRVAFDAGGSSTGLAGSPSAAPAALSAACRVPGTCLAIRVASSARAGRSLAVALLGFFVVTLDALVVNVALPAIGGELGGGITGLQWVVDAYTLTFAALLLSAGVLADRIGARRVYGAGLALFVASSAVCAVAPTITVLVVARLIQGAGAAAMMPASLALIREAYRDPAQRARAIAVWSLGGAVASATGPVVGGFLALVSWRTIFLINLPAGAVALYLLLGVAPSPRRPASFDWAGQGLAIVGMGALLYSLIEGGAHGFAAPHIWGSRAAAVVAIIAFLSVQLGRAHPMVPLGLFRARPVAVSVAGGFAFTVGFYGLVFLLSLYFQQVRGLSPAETGLAFVPMTALTGVLTLVSPRIAARYGPRVPMAAGQFLQAAGLLGLCLAVAEAPAWLVAGLTVLIGFGGALAVPTLTALLVGSVPAERAGTASGVLNTGRQLGGALAVADFGALVANPQTFLPGMQLSLIIAAALLLATAAASLTLRDGAGAWH